MHQLKSGRLLAATGLVAILGIVAGCGGSGGTGSTGGNGGSYPSSAKVTIPKADRFEPFLLEVRQGATVTFTNEDTDTHTVRSMPTDPVDFNLVVQSGKTVSETFNQPGIYGYYCDAHSAYDPATGLIKAHKDADAYPISMYGMIVVVGNTLPTSAGRAKIVMPEADRFEPLAIAVKTGTQVSWSNLDTDAHTVLTDPGQKVQFKFVVPANGSASYTFSQPGIYAYYCDAHATWNSELKRVQARAGSSEYPAAMEGVVFVIS